MAGDTTSGGAPPGEKAFELNWSKPKAYSNLLRQTHYDKVGNSLDNSKNNEAKAIKQKLRAIELNF
jgi:hypothetical protein